MPIEKKSTHSWVSSDPSKLPDFIIVGAMKCGTTTLHSMLDTHPDVFIPKGELHFFDHDNIFEHHDFLMFNETNEYWNYPSLKKNPKEMWEWYTNKFKGKENLVKGEDSTIYLASENAAKRIAQQDKPIKIVINLRNPTKRAYSQYYHMLRSGRAMYSFEDTLKYAPHSIINRSLYKTQIENYLKYIPKKSIKFVIFEDFIKDPKATLKDVSKFLNIDFNKFESDVFKLHSNKSKLPRYTELQLFRNRNFRTFGNMFYKDHFPYVFKNTKTKDPLILRIIFKIHNLINPQKEKSPPPINVATKDFLNDFFKSELSGLNELVGKDVLGNWFPQKLK
jgi:hypothetical protein